MPRQSIVFLPVPDLTFARTFFGEWLGLPLALDQGTCLIFRTHTGAYWGFCQCDTPVPENLAEKIMLTLVEDDVEGWYEHLLRVGVKTDGPPRENPRYQIHHFFAEAPGGYRLEVQRFLDSAWDPTA